MSLKKPLESLAFTALTGATLLASASFVHAQETRSPGELLPSRPGEFALKVEPGLAIPLSPPQSRLFDIGGGQTLKALWTLSPFFDIGPSATFVTMSAAGDAPAENGTAWAFGASARLKRPHHASAQELYAISPWLDIDALYVRTGDLNRPGVAAAVGFAVPIGVSRTFWLGPFVRYLHIFQGTPDGFDNRDAKILSVGLSLEVGAGVEREPERAAFAADAPLVQNDVVPCPDRDGDGVPDSVDRCPEVVGTTDNWGCRAYDKIIVKKDKLELKERLYFAWDQATLQEVSFPVLDEVVLALKENKNFRVQVQGHSSSEGGPERNQTLSEQRAKAVLDYLVAHGVEQDRLVSQGFSSSVPTDTNSTPAGRDNNRRVEFVVNFIILDGGTN